MSCSDIEIVTRHFLEISKAMFVENALLRKSWSELNAMLRYVCPFLKTSCLKG